MIDGTYLGRPPVDIGRSAAARTLASMMRGGSYYSGAAGGGAPLAMPMLQPGFPSMPAANPNTNPEITVLYPLNNQLAKTNLRQRFGIQ